MSEVEKQPGDENSTKSVETTRKPGRFRSSMRSVFGRGQKGRKNDETSQSKDKLSSKESGNSNSRKGSAEAVSVCPVCYVVKPQTLFPNISTCEHRTCGDCLRQYMTIEINESRVNLTCPECSERFHPNDIKFVLNDEVLMNKYNEFTLRRTLVSDPDCRWCPAPDCGYAVIAAGCASCRSSLANGRNAKQNSAITVSRSGTRTLPATWQGREGLRIIGCSQLLQAMARVWSTART